jgi:hypothetical protein
VLTDDPERLRFLGIDLHSRTHRRVIVVLTYLVYLVAMTVIEMAFEDRPIPQSGFYSFPGGFLEVGLMYAATFSMAFGIFRKRGPVKSFDQSQASFKSYGDKLTLETRDDWAKYLYGESFVELSPDRQDEVRHRQRPGRYLVPYKHFPEPGIPDEREVAEANRASRRALNILGLLLALTAGQYMAGRARHIRPDGVAETFLEFAVAALTLPKAIILWREPDPRDSSQLEDVRAQEAAN